MRLAATSAAHRDGCWKLTFCEHNIRDSQRDGALMLYAHSGSTANAAARNATRPTTRSVPPPTPIPIPRRDPLPPPVEDPPRPAA